MKKFLVCIALMGLISVPALAEVGQHSGMELLPLNAEQSQTAGRASPYTAGQSEIYDHLAANVGGMGPGAAWVSGYSPSAWLFDDVHANTTLNSTFNHMHLVIQGTDTGAAGNTTRTQFLAYFGNPGGLDTTNGGILATTAGAPALFAYALPVFNPGYAQWWELPHSPIATPAGGHMYAGWLSFDNMGVWGSSSPNQSVGTSHLGTGTVTTTFTTTTTTTTTTSGAVNVNVNVNPNFNFNATVMGIRNGLTASGTANYGPPTGAFGGFMTTGNLLFSLGYTPEPATIGVLALGGLIALRRRRA